MDYRLVMFFAGGLTYSEAKALPHWERQVLVDLMERAQAR